MVDQTFLSFSVILNEDVQLEPTLGLVTKVRNEG